MTILLLGGTAEARALASRLVIDGVPVISSLAGRVRDPALPVGQVRIGGFGGVSGLAAYLRDVGVTAVVDATHPFAATITAHAVAAAATTGTPLLRLERPGWADHPYAGDWTWVPTVADAVSAGASATRPFLTTGRQSLTEFATWYDKAVLVRVVDLPEEPLPPAWTLVQARGPYAVNGEAALMTRHGTDLLVTKDSGGALTEAKLVAAKQLGVAVLVVARPPSPAGVPLVRTVAEAYAWARSIGDSGTFRGTS